MMDNMGTVIPAITTDITGALRSSPPDIGAIEYLYTGMKNLNRNFNIIYPNPVGDKIQIAGIAPDAILSIYNLAGERIQDSFPGHPNTTIDTGALRPGIYFLHVESRAGNDVWKFVKVD
jgi:hypothetical protein